NLVFFFFLGVGSFNPIFPFTNHQFGGKKKGGKKLPPFFFFFFFFFKIPRCFVLYLFSLQPPFSTFPKFSFPPLHHI
ncbi:hypothetical protein, partial [Limosilactobacillus reuteri]|uniref:hypothetical protein n=1 Tax=Limosilactobacillus reuteri TaxID=1598 RepID=UPI001CDA8A32